MKQLWAIGRFDLHLSDADFFAMTPALFSLLCERHRQERAHREMVAGITTAAVINTTVQLDKPVTWTDFAPSHRAFNVEPVSILTDAQRRLIHEHNVRALEMEVRLRAEKEQ